MSDNQEIAEIRKKTPERLRLTMETTLNPAINPVIEPIVHEFKAALQSLYGDRLHGVVLYGSYARGDYNEESDIDLMVLLNDEQVNTYTEIFQMSDLSMDFILRYGIAVSVLPAPIDRYRNSFGPVYQDARCEGIWL